MVLVFALAAALCLQGFVTAQDISRTGEAQDRAVTAAQQAAETLKARSGDGFKTARDLGGTMSGNTLTLTYDNAWSPLPPEEAGAYTLTIEPTDSGQPLLGTAQITVSTNEGDLLFALPVAWQEVTPNG